MQSIRYASNSPLFTINQTAFIEYCAVTQGASAYVSLQLIDDGSLTLITKNGIKISKHSHNNKIDLKLLCQFKDKKIANDIINMHGNVLKHAKHSVGDDVIIFDITALSEDAVKETLKIIQLNDNQINDALSYIYATAINSEEKSVSKSSLSSTSSTFSRLSISSSPMLPQRPSKDSVRRLSVFVLESCNQSDISEEDSVIYLPSSPRSTQSARASCPNTPFVTAKNTKQLPRRSSLPVQSSRLFTHTETVIPPPPLPYRPPEINK